MSSKFFLHDYQVLNSDYVIKDNNTSWGSVSKNTQDDYCTLHNIGVMFQLALQLHLSISVHKMPFSLTVLHDNLKLTLVVSAKEDEMSK